MIIIRIVPHKLLSRHYKSICMTLSFPPLNHVRLYNTSETFKGEERIPVMNVCEYSWCIYRTKGPLFGSSFSLFQLEMTQRETKDKHHSRLRTTMARSYFISSRRGLPLMGNWGLCITQDAFSTSNVSNLGKIIIC